jgi:hypothetical protein
MTDIGDWLDRYGDAWRSGDGAAAAALFANDGVYCWGPYERLEGGDQIRARWEEATRDQGPVHFEWDLLGQDGPRWFVHWRTRIEPGAEAGVELDGAFVLDFDREGLCRHLQEWWLARPLA